MRVRHYQVTPTATAATIDAGPGEPQTTILFRCGDWGVDLMVAFIPYPKKHVREDDCGSSKRLA